MRFACTPSNVLTALLVLIIAASPLRAFFAVPPKDSVAHIFGDHLVVGNVAKIDGGERTSSLTLAKPVVDDQAYSGRVLVRVPKYPVTQLGDRVSVFCNLAAPQPFDGFAYDRYLAIRDVFAVCTADSMPLVVERHADRTLFADLARLRMSVLARISAVLPEPESALLAGLLLGQSEFSSTWEEYFAVTGTSHIAAASGYNVSLVVIVLLSLFAYIGIHRRYAVGVVALGIVAYVIIAGGEPSVIRAGIMGGLLLLAKSLGRKTSMRNIFLVAVAAMLVVEPRLLLWDVGFQLSVLSTAALLWFAPKLEERLQWIPQAFGIRAALVGSLAATAFTLPLSVFAFERVSLVSPFVNLLILPVIPFAMLAGGIGIAAGPFAALPAWSLLAWILGTISAIAHVPISAVRIPDSFRGVLAVCAVGIIAWLCRRIARSSSASSSSC